MKLGPEYLPVLDQHIAQLEADVQTAPTLNRSDKYSLYLNWKNSWLLTPMIEEDFSLVEEPYRSAIEMLAVGVMGLARIYYQDLTSRFQPWEILSAQKYSNRYSQQQRDFDKIDDLEHSLHAIEVYHLPPWTIDRQAIDWFGELGQLMVEKQIKVGNYEAALKLLYDVEIAMEKRRLEIPPVPHQWHVSDQALDAQDPRLFKARYQYKGHLAAQSRLSIRRAQLENTFGSWSEAFKRLKKSQKRHPQPEVIQEARFLRAKSTILHSEKYTFSEILSILGRAPRTWLELYSRHIPDVKQDMVC